MKRIIAIGRILRGGKVEMVTARDAETAAMDADLAELTASGWEPIPSSHDWLAECAEERIGAEIGGQPWLW